MLFGGYVSCSPLTALVRPDSSDSSSLGHQAYLGIQEIDWMSTDWVLQRFDRIKSAARKEYQRFALRGLDEEYRKEFHTGNKGGVALGDEEFILKIPEYGKSKLFKNEPTLVLSDISKRVCNFFQIPESQIVAENRSHSASKVRSLVALLISEQAGSISQVADYFGKDVSTLSRQLSNLKQKMLTDGHLKQEFKTLKKQKNAKTQA